VAAGLGGGLRKYSQVVDLQSTCSCSNLPSYPPGGTGGVLNGSPLICGGWGGAIGERSYLQSSCYMYDKTSQAWQLHANMTSKRSYSASALIKEALWVTGGYDGSNFLASSELIYPNGTVTSGPNLPAARFGHCMVNLHDGKVMILGGTSGTPRYPLIFDPADNSFTNGPSLLYDRSYAGCSLFLSPLHDNRPVVLAAGGQEQATAEVLDYTNANSWEEIGALPTTHDSNFFGARALPSLAGDGAILQAGKNLYELTCTSTFCNWSIMEKQLRNPAYEAVMMYLPPGYTC